ncbi:MAG: (d)CMP kinase [Pyrinomonadaceae bacterium]
MIIAIDGPSGAGKSTLGKMLAEKLNLLYLDTGAMYRAVGLAVLRAGIKEEDEKRIGEIARQAEIKLVGPPDDQRVFLNGRDVSAEIRTGDAGRMASIVSALPAVRRLLVERQKTLGKTAENGAVLDGRDIGTVVFPDADVKFFLTAKPEMRARRRFEEDLEKGRAVNFQQTLADILERDQRDVSREASPLKIAEDAIVIDTSELDLPQVFEQMMSVIRKREAVNG